LIIICNALLLLLYFEIVDVNFIFTYKAMV